MRAARTVPDPATRWRHLERAHILSQPWPWPHTRITWRCWAYAGWTPTVIASDVITRGDP
ncbi:DUF3703 domain-containing protein [Streptosporangium sp. KLBMP 9127]|nr:DUF3703 domain-containing protein [Streptosporangium sp. KLBMP 9127]